LSETTRFELPTPRVLRSRSTGSGQEERADRGLRWEWFFPDSILRPSIENRCTRGIKVARRASLIREQGIEDVVVGVRPEHIALTGEGQSGIPMRVELVEYLGSFSVMLISV